MLKFSRFVPLFALALILPSVSFAAQKTYQVTGAVISATNDVLVVEKGNEKWEIARDASTKSAAEIKTGDKVTVQYRMTATDIEVKGGAKTTSNKPKQ